jgi:hypothetical protein
MLHYHSESADGEESQSSLVYLARLLLLTPTSIDKRDFDHLTKEEHVELNDAENPIKIESVTKMHLP